MGFPVTLNLRYKKNHPEAESSPPHLSLQIYLQKVYFESTFPGK